FWCETEISSDKTHKKTNWLPVRFLVIILLVSLSLLFWVFVLPVLELSGGLYGMTQAREKIAKGESEDAGKWAARSAYLFSAAAPGFEQWRTFPGLKNESKALSSKSKLLARFANLGQKGAGIYAKTQTFFNSTLGGESGGAGITGSELAVELASLEQEAAFLDAEMGESDFALDLPLSAPLSILTKEDLARYRKLLNSGAVILNQTDDLLGAKLKKTYLVLFQNNTELRPTGGFIGSFGLVTFEKGRLSNFEIQDVYSADGQLKGHVDAPRPLVDHLGEEGWYLRDSNWNPDFPASAARAIWFIDKELDQKVDGVVAIDLEFAKNILRDLGGLELADFGETIYADNLYEKAQSRAENNFFPGSRAKKDYLSAIGRGVFQKITQNALTPSQLAKIILTSLEEKHLLVWTDNTKVNTTLKANGWDGSLRNVTCPTSSCIDDYLYVVEANLGVNKSNYFLERRSALDINAGEHGLKHTLTINYKNNSQAGVWPGGDYKNYLRLYAPQGAVIESATLTGATSDEILEINETIEKGKTVFGMLAVVPSGEIRELRIKWTVPLKETFNANTGELLFLWQKQPGTINDPLTLRFNLPKGSYKVAANPVPSLTDEGSIGYNTTLTQDLLFDIAWQAKQTIN
ncbi:MAG: DUF4012 domain-containing protein, partial [bacterium]|nr:DUF4012 domain-containing protein [bacterium]